MLLSTREPLTQSTWDEMAEEARPVVVGSGETEKKMKVLVGVDGSEGGLCALQWALDHLCGGMAGSEVVLLLLHVQQLFQHFVAPAWPAVYETSTVVDCMRKEQEQNTNRILSQVKKICTEKRVTAETLVMVRDPKEMICQAGEQMKVDLVVVGSRGLSTIKRAFLGSVSNYVAHHAPCPVLIVKPQKQTGEQAARTHA